MINYYNTSNDELNILVAQKVFGFRELVAGKDIDGNYGDTPYLAPPGLSDVFICKSLPKRGEIPYGYFVPRYSEFQELAMNILKHYGERGKDWRIQHYIDTVMPYRVVISDDESHVSAYAHGDSLERVICVCALKFADLNSGKDLNG